MTKTVFTCRTHHLERKFHFSGEKTCFGLNLGRLNSAALLDVNSVNRRKVQPTNLEGVDKGLVILDINLGMQYRLVNVYRVINPTNGVNQRDFFQNQLGLIKLAVETAGTRKSIIMGDFNLDESNHVVSYQRKQ